jgi:hypothetical protein
MAGGLGLGVDTKKVRISEKKSKDKREKIK